MACNYHPKDRGSWAKADSCFQGPDFFSRVSTRSVSLLIFNFSVRRSLEPGHWKESSVQPHIKSCERLKYSALSVCPRFLLRLSVVPNSGLTAPSLAPTPTPHYQGGNVARKSLTHVGKEAKCLTYILNSTLLLWVVRLFKATWINTLNCKITFKELKLFYFILCDAELAIILSL